MEDGSVDGQHTGGMTSRGDAHADDGGQVTLARADLEALVQSAVDRALASHSHLSPASVSGEYPLGGVGCYGQPRAPRALLAPPTHGSALTRRNRILAIKNKKN